MPAVSCTRHWHWQSATTWPAGRHAWSSPRADDTTLHTTQHTHLSHWDHPLWPPNPHPSQCRTWLMLRGASTIAAYTHTSVTGIICCSHPTPTRQCRTWLMLRGASTIAAYTHTSGIGIIHCSHPHTHLNHWDHLL